MIQIADPTLSDGADSIFNKSFCHLKAPRHTEQIYSLIY